MSNCKFCGKNGGRLFKSGSTGYLWCTKCLQAFAMSDKTDEESFRLSCEPVIEAQAQNSPMLVNETKQLLSIQANVVTFTHSKGGKPC